MKKLILPVALVLLLCSCSGDKTAPKLSVADRIYLGQNEAFDIAEFCEAKDDSGEVSVKYEGKLDESKLGDYKITAVAEDKAGNRTEKSVVVTVRANKRKLSNDTICKQVREYMFAFIAAGHPNIEFCGYSDDVGFFSKAYSKQPYFETASGFPATLSFEAIQYEDYKASVMNYVFSIDSDAMWYFPERIELSGGGEKLEFDVVDTFQSGKNYGFVSTLGELSEKKDKLVPDYKMVENLRSLISSKNVTMRAYGEKDVLELKLTNEQLADFSDILTVYEQLLTYY